MLTVGGGSVTDAAKMVGLCLGNDVTGAGTTRRVPRRGPRGWQEPSVRRRSRPACGSSPCPTTLSAGEFTSGAGCTDTARHVKESYTHALMMPSAVILDPAVTVHTPEWLFLSTGIRAVDHAVEDICSINPQPFSDGASMQALRLLSRGLPAVKADPGDLAARLDCQLGAWMSIMGSQNGVTKGASHGIGHVLGRHGGRAARLHVVRDAAARAAVQRTGERGAAGAGRPRLGPPGMKAADAVAALIAGWACRRRCVTWA